MGVSGTEGSWDHGDYREGGQGRVVLEHAVEEGRDSDREFGLILGATGNRWRPLTLETNSISLVCLKVSSGQCRGWIGSRDGEAGRERRMVLPKLERASEVSWMTDMLLGMGTRDLTSDLVTVPSGMISFFLTREDVMQWEGKPEDQVLFTALLLSGASLVSQRKSLTEELYTKHWAQVSTEDIFWTI